MKVKEIKENFEIAYRGTKKMFIRNMALREKEGKILISEKNLKTLCNSMYTQGMLDNSQRNSAL